MEILKILTQFLTRYLSHNPANIESNLAEALNLMTVNLRRSALYQLRETDLVGKVKEQNLTSDIKITSILPSKDIQYAFTVLVVKEVRQVRKGVENTDRIVSAHYVRLVLGERSVENPYGVFVAEYWEKPVYGEKDNSAVQKTEIESLR